MTRYVVLTGLGIFIATVIAGSIYGVLPDPIQHRITCGLHIQDARDCK